MSKDQARKLLDIPGEKLFIHPFKFNITLPPPIPHPKSLYYPFDPDRYVKPKLTLFNMKKKASILTDVTLSMPVDQINMRPELYNPEANQTYTLSKEDQELLNEVTADETRKTGPQSSQIKIKAELGAATNSLTKTAGTSKVSVQSTTPDKIQSTSTTSIQKSSIKKEENEHNYEKKVEISSFENRLNPEKIPQPKINENNIGKAITHSFDKVKKVQIGMKYHVKPGVTCSKVYNMLPDFNNIGISYSSLKPEVISDILKSKKNVLKIDTDADKQAILALYLYQPEDEKIKEIDEVAQYFKDDNSNSENIKEEDKEKSMKEKIENRLKEVQTFEHTGNYVYNKLQDTKKKEYILSINDDVASLVKPTSIILKKRKIVYKDAHYEDLDDGKQKQTKIILKVIPREYNKEEINLKKRKFNEFKLQNTKFYGELNRKDYGEDDEIIEGVKAKILKTGDENNQNSEVAEDDDEIVEAMKSNNYKTEQKNSENEDEKDEDSEGDNNQEQPSMAELEALFEKQNDDDDDEDEDES